MDFFTYFQKFNYINLSEQNSKKLTKFWIVEIFQILCKINWFRILTESSSKNLNNNYYHRLRQFENENFQLKLAFRVQLNGLPLGNRPIPRQKPSRPAGQSGNKMIRLSWFDGSVDESPTIARRGHISRRPEDYLPYEKSASDSQMDGSIAE